MNKFDASVIIPTYNRKESLYKTLHSLSQQTYPLDRFEVIVVDDGSTDGTEGIVEERLGLTLCYVRQSNQGSAAARNAGAKQASGVVFIFLDDDMLVKSDYVAGLIEEHQAYSRIVGMGTELPYIPSNASVFAKVRACGNASLEASADGDFVDFTQCVTNNLSVERGDFFEIGMMQDVAGDGPTWWGDVDFGYRAHQLGFRFRRSGKAVCYHRDYSTRDLRATSARYYKAAQMAVPLFHKFPGIKPHLPMFHDKAPISWKQDSPRRVVRKIARCVASSQLALGGMERLATALEHRYPSPTLLHPLYRWILGAYIFRGYREGLREYGAVKRGE